MASKRQEVSNHDIERLKDKVIQDYFYQHYDNTDVTPYGLCSLCGNMGVIDTRGRAISGAGIDAGRLNYCICPNGVEMRKQKAKLMSREEHLAWHAEYVKEMRAKHGI